MQEILNMLLPLFEAYGGDLGIVIQAVSLIGSLRIINKPLFSLFHAIVEVTYWTEKDNHWLNKIEQSKIYKGILYVIDWVSSVKVGEK